MKKKKSMQWILTYGGVGSLIGLTIGPIIKKGTFELTGLLAGLTVFIVAFIIDLIRFLNKKDKTPDYDERTIYNIRKYYGYVFNIFIIITFLFLAVLTFMGFNKIAISYIWIYFTSIFVISGIGALFALKK